MPEPNQVLYIKIPRSLFRQLVERAKKFDISLKEFVVAAIEEAVETKEEENLVVGTDPAEPAPGE